MTKPTKLPKLSKDVSLSKSGYKVKKSDQERHKSLKKASKKYGSLVVLRRLNLVRNYNKNKEIEGVLSNDVNYMSDLHKQGKSMGRVPKRVTKNKSKVSKKAVKKVAKKGTKGKAI
jgi:hypothetical protein